MSEHLLHPATEQLDDYVAEQLADGDRVVLESHLLTCPRCQSELDEIRSLFKLLSGLPQIEPSTGFADRVVLKLRIREPLGGRALGWLKALLPQSTIGLTLATAFLGLPLLLGGGVLAWLTTMPGVTWQGLWLYGQGRLAQLLYLILTSSISRLAESDIVAGMATAAQVLAGGAGGRQLITLAGIVGLASILSVWVLYTNLTRTPIRELPYAR
jgi:hypothetical protein